MSVFSEPTNEDRRQRARNVMDAYLGEIGDARIDPGHLADLLADLMHMTGTDTDNWPDFNEALASARINFAAEKDEDAREAEDAASAFVERVARFTLYSPGSTSDFDDAMTTCNRLIADARKLAGMPDQSAEEAEDWACENCGETSMDGSGTCVTCGHEEEEPATCTQHRDTGRGVCADCGTFLPVKG